MAISGLFIGAAAAQNEANRVAPPADHTFAMAFVQGGMAEVQLGKLAAERGKIRK